MSDDDAVAGAGAGAGDGTATGADTPAGADPRGDARLAAAIPDCTKTRIDEGAEKVGKRVARRLPGTVTAAVRELLARDPD